MGSADRKLKIMLLNPVAGPGFAEWIADAIREYKDPNTLLTITSLADRIGGTKTLAYPSVRPLLYAELIRACLQARKEGYDAIVVNCFGDPLVNELRQICGDMIIVGVREAAVQAAARLGGRYAVMLPYEMEGLPDPFFEGLVQNTGAVVHPVVDAEFNEDLTLRNVGGLQERMAVLGRRAIERDGAEVLVLGCTAMMGCWARLMRAVGVPVIDPTIAALKVAVASAELRRQYGWGTSAKRGLNVPGSGELEMISLSEKTYPFSRRIEVE
ncbi:Asp/Glu/Hydantoin racemase-domain-containing protein [Aspergillus californicus]